MPPGWERVAVSLANLDASGQIALLADQDFRVAVRYCYGHGNLHKRLLMCDREGPRTLKASQPTPNPCRSKAEITEEARTCKQCKSGLLSGLRFGATGFEPATFCTPCRRASQAAPRPGLSP